jgi:hypothetical protein
MTNIEKVFQIMYQIKAFIADIDILNETNKTKIESHHHKQIIDVSNLNLENRKNITFGIYSRLIYDWTIEVRYCKI